MTYTDDDLDRIIAVLEDAGDDWESIAAELPEVRTYESAHGSARAVVELNAPSQSNLAAGIADKYALLYRSEAGEEEDEDGRPISWPATWHPVGWSNASRARLGRSIHPDGVELHRTQDTPDTVSVKLAARCRACSKPQPPTPTSTKAS